MNRWERAADPSQVKATGPHPRAEERPPSPSAQMQPVDAIWDLDLLTADDVCSLLKVKKSWLYDTVEAGAIEVIRLGKQLRFQRSAISAYLTGRASGQDTPDILPLSG